MDGHAPLPEPSEGALAQRKRDRRASRCRQLQGGTRRRQRFRMSDEEYAESARRDMAAFQDMYGGDKARGIEAMMFPTSFPYGTGTYGQTAPGQCRFDDYVIALHRRHGSRFQSDPMWLTWAMETSSNILEQRAYLREGEEKDKPRCAYWRCDKLLAKRNTCSACKKRHYCGRECQRADWKESNHTAGAGSGGAAHKHMCKLLQKYGYGKEIEIDM